MFGGEWESLAQNITLPLGESAPVIGNGKALGLTNDGTSSYSLGLTCHAGGSGGYSQLMTMKFNSSPLPITGSELGNRINSNVQHYIGVTTNEENSGLKVNLNLTNSIKVWIWKKI